MIYVYVRPRNLKNEAVQDRFGHYCQRKIKLVPLSPSNPTGVLISPWTDKEGNKLGSMSGTRAISTTSRRELLSSFFFLQGKAPKEIHAILTETLDCLLPVRAKDLSAPLFIFKAQFNAILPTASRSSIFSPFFRFFVGASYLSMRATCLVHYLLKLT